MSRKSILTVSILALAVSSGIGNAQQTETKGETIVVTAMPLSETEKRLKDCIARACSPDEDIAATLAHAENQFISGDYTGARSTIRKSIGRNHDEAKNYPLDVSGLYRAGATIDAHLGERDDFLRSTVLSRDALKAGLPAEDPRILLSQLEVGDMRARLGYFKEAEGIYQGVAKRGAELNYPGVVARARLRDAWLFAEMSDPKIDETGEYRQKARQKYNAIITDYEGRAPNLVFTAKLGLARIDREDGNMGSTSQLITEFVPTAEAGSRPSLIYAPAINNRDVETSRHRIEGIEIPDTGSMDLKMLAYQTHGTAKKGPMELFDNHWADVGFWVRPDGTVADVEVLRARGHTRWLAPVFTSIKTRRYTPTKGDPTDPGFYFIERYTITSHYENDKSQTRVRGRGAMPRIERLDLTVEPPAQTKPTS